MRAALLLLLFGCATAAPRPLPVRQGEKEVLDLLEVRVRETLDALDHPADRAAWERETPRLRKSLREAIGLDRLPRPEPKNIRVVGTIERRGYRIEKLIYQTLPEIDVPAHLYLPKVEGRRPAVLFVPGHWYADSKTKTDFQAFCVTMALRGFVVLAYDPIGQGERGISLRDHRRTELLPGGVAQQAVVAYETLCALELLLAHPEVDAARVGMTGASGGGFNSWIVPALDPRIAVTVPVVGTSEFAEQIAAVRERDWYDAKEHCHFVPGLLRFANNHELLALVAPRPLLILAAHDDHSFRIPGNRAVADYGRRLYAALGTPEKIGYAEDAVDGHGYQTRKRAAAVGWFLKWLANEGDGAPVVEGPLDLPPWNAPELRCFPEHRPAGPGLAALARSIAARTPTSSGPMAERLRDVLGLSLPPRLTASSKLLREENGRVAWRMRDGLSIPGELMAPPGEWKGALLAAADAGRASLREQGAVKAARAAGFAILLCDPRGMGELATTKPGWVYAVSLLLGESFSGRQAMDLVGGWRALSALPELRGKPVAILGAGPAAAQAALFAAVLEPRVAGLLSDGGFSSWLDLVDRPVPDSFRLLKSGEEAKHRVDAEIPAALLPFDVLRRFDLPALRASLDQRPSRVLGLLDPDLRPRAGSPVGDFFIRLSAREVAAAPVGANETPPIARGSFPLRVHVAEDYTTEIEKRWWLAGEREEGVCRGTIANDFDDKMGDPSRLYTAVIFNPVPGPPMGPRTRLAFRCKLQGGGDLRVQIYSLSNGYHRHLTLKNLPQGVWQPLTVDLTRARRPDGSGGPLGEDERIDDIQFYADPTADLWIDDIALYDAGDESAPFPSRLIFTGGFDTGRQGKEWPGQFEIVPIEKGKAAKSVGTELRVGLRGTRPVNGPARLRFRYRLTGADAVRLAGRTLSLSRDVWAQADVEVPPGPVEELAFELPAGATLMVDDVLLYQP